MRTIETEVLVIGGGATGTGVVRDLAMRGFKTVLVEKRDLTHGTTGRYHGLLHSGGRYAVKDPQAARECIEENRILRKIMPFCIEDTGGFFVLTPWDDPNYVPDFVEGCRQSGIPVEEISIDQMLREEPMLNPQITRCFRVPDASADSFLGADANAESARQYGALVLPYHPVSNLQTANGRVIGARCQDLIKDEPVIIRADMVVNASGAWAGQIAATAFVNVHIIGGKGIMIAANHRIVNTVINRCKMPSDGDILVPAHTVAIIGTTDTPVEDPDHYAIEPWEVDLCMQEGDKLVPGFTEMRMLRAWAGVRPLYQESDVRDTRDVTRAFVLLDHSVRDNLEGLVTITSGKWTTYRKMAEETVDLVCKKLGVSRECRTHLEEIPNPQRHKIHGYHHLGMRLAEVEDKQKYGDLICECELATYDDVVQAITIGEAATLDDIRRDVRVGMGPCQGGFCTFRTAGILHRLRSPDVRTTNAALRDFLQERWKGLLPILWGQQLRQERLDELIYLSIFNTDHLPGPPASQLAPAMYKRPTWDGQSNLERGSSMHKQDKRSLRATEPNPPAVTMDSAALRPIVDVVIVGAGLAGLAAGWQATEHGKRTRIIAKGWGALYWHTGCIDVLGYYPLDSITAVDSPGDAVASLIQENPGHPYALTGIDGLESAMDAFKTLCQEAGYPLQGTLERNWLLPSSVGAFRPTCLAPETMTAGDLRTHEPMLILGFDGYRDFFPELIAANLETQGIPARCANLSLDMLRERKFVLGRTLAELFGDEEFRDQVAQAARRHLDTQTARIGFPAVLGYEDACSIHLDLQARLGLPIFEIPTIPASISGIRLNRILAGAVRKNGGRVFDGMEALRCEASGKQLVTIFTEAAARQKPHRGGSFVLATGGILGGGIRGEYDGRQKEVVCNLPVTGSSSRPDWLREDFLDSNGHPVYRSGMAVDKEFRPLGGDGQPVYENLFAAGGNLAQGEFLRERSLDGVALATGYLIGKKLGQQGADHD